ncbi:hypothetical protein ScPMuIL_015048 [Solemya velum]
MRVISYGVKSSTLKMHCSTRLKITDLNPHLICVLCGGYFIDATTVIECLHSYCRSCIVRYLESNKFCPICDVVIHKTKPLTNLRSDKTLQDLVYKLVPGMYKNEMKRRREYYTGLAKDVAPARLGPSEDRGDEVGRIIYTEDENISLSLEFCSECYYFDQSRTLLTSSQYPFPFHCIILQVCDVRYLRCPAALTVAHLKKYIQLKFDIPLKYQIDIFHTEESLCRSYSLMDIAYIYTWRRKGPIRLFYTVYEGKNSAKRQKFVHINTQSSQTETQINTSNEHAPVVSSTTTPTGEQKNCVGEKTVDSSFSGQNKDKHRHKNGLQCTSVNSGMEKVCHHKDKKTTTSSSLSNHSRNGHVKYNKTANGSSFTHTQKRPEHSILVKDKIQKVNGLNGFSKATVHFRD